MRFLARIAPCEVASIDEAYLDITEIIERGHSPKEAASYIQRKLESELHIPCSITLEVPTDQADDIYRIAMHTYELHFSDRPIRLFGIRLSNLTAQVYEQLRFSF